VLRITVAQGVPADGSGGGGGNKRQSEEQGGGLVNGL
jgi:hypothetical protein